MGEDAQNEPVEAARLTAPVAPSVVAPAMGGAPTERELVGRTLGPFRIESHIGSGGMGAVYRATDERLGRSVAVKLLPRGGAEDGPRLESLLREARAAATIDHPNAVKIFDVGELDGTPCLVMELVSGKTLRPFVRDSSIAIQRKLGWLTDVARALSVAHEKGVIHQDVKPDNVMLDDDGVVKVLDFGIARRMVEPERKAAGAPGSWEVRGTAVYMAPERMRGETGDALSDQFAWGVFAYELLSGRVPWPMGDGMDQLVDDILTYEPPPLLDRCPGVSAAVDEIVSRAMAKRPARRFPSMNDIVAALVDASHAPGLERLERVERNEKKSAATWRSRALHSPFAALVVALFGTAPVADAAVVAPALGIFADESTAVASPPDYGSVMSENSDAAAAYRLGIQAMRNAAYSSARKHLERAVVLAPSFAAANLRKVLSTPLVTDAERANLLEATELRDTLSDHDRALLQAIGPWVTIPQDTQEIERRLIALTADRPDPDYLYQLCRFRVIAGNYTSAIEACRGARALDPSFAAPVWLEGLSRWLLGDSVGGTEAYAECLRISPEATSCLNDFLQLSIRQGSCGAAFGYAARLVALEPDDENWLEELGGTAYAMRPGVDARVAFERWSKATSAAPASVERASTRARIATLAGDLGEAAAQLDVSDGLVRSRSDEFSHAELFKLHAQFEHETGRDRVLVARARSFLASRAAWSPSLDGDASIEALIALYRGGAMSRSDFVLARAEWLARERSRPPPAARLGMSPGRRWITAYAKAVVTRDDATDAVAVLPEYQPLPEERARGASDDEPIGAAFLAAGDPERALPFLRRAAGSCDAAYSPFHHTWANVELGEVLESRDVAAACAAYAVVIARWGGAPRSRTAETARNRWKQLGCR